MSTVRTQWLVTDALNTVDKTLKAGDALRISAGDEEDWDGSEVRLTVTTIDGVSEEHVFPDNLPLVIQFDSTSTVTVTYRGQTASFTITAVQPAAPQSTFIASQKGRERPSLATRPSIQALTSAEVSTSSIAPTIMKPQRPTYGYTRASTPP